MKGASGAGEAPARDREALLARVMLRMNEAGGFPALDHSVTQIVEALEVGDEDVTPLINAVLADVSLTQKVLRLANSVMYAPIGGAVATVSHAMMVLGFEAVGHLALGVKVIGSLGRMETQTPAAERELARSLLAGSVAGSVAGKLPVKNGEIGVVCTLLHRVGRLLAAFYLNEEWERMQRAVAAGRDETEAARAELGMTLEELGAAIARQWRLPAKIVRTMPGENDGAPVDGEDWLLALTRFADESAAVLASGVGEEARRQLQEKLATRFAPRLGLPGTELLEATRAATVGANAEPLLAGILLERPLAGVRPAGIPASIPASDDLLGKLLEGEREVRQALDEGGTPSAIMNMVLEVVFSALGLSRAAVFLLDDAQRVFRVRATLAVREPNALSGLSIPAAFSSDLPHVAMAKKVDIYIDNPRDGDIAPHMPAWIRSHALHPFFLLPMLAGDGNALGLLFGQQRDDFKLGKPELAQLAALRNLLQARLIGKAR